MPRLQLERRVSPLLCEYDHARDHDYMYDHDLHEIIRISTQKLTKGGTRFFQAIRSDAPWSWSCSWS